MSWGNPFRDNLHLCHGLRQVRAVREISSEEGESCGEERDRGGEGRGLAMRRAMWRLSARTLLQAAIALFGMHLFPVLRWRA